MYLRAIIIDDEQKGINALKILIERHIEDVKIVAESISPKCAIALIENYKPEIVFLDINMPEMNGFDTAAFLLHRYPGMKILIVSMLPEVHHLEKCLQLGICGYIQKDANIEELQQAIEQIIQKGYYVNPASCIHLLSKRTSEEEFTAAAAQQAAALSDREKEFLTWLCTDKGYKEIAREMFVSPRTIDGYRDALLKKLKVASRIGLVTFAIRQGIVELP